MNIPKISKRFETSLASSLSASGSSFTTVSATDDDGNALSGLYALSIDVGNADVEDVIATVSGTTWTIVYRGIDADAPNTEITANKKLHRRGAPVVITDYPIMAILRNILNGDDTLPNKISYVSHPTFSSNTELIDKKYADDLVVSGAPDASVTTKGLVEEATQAEVEAGTAAGGTSARLFINPSTLRAKRFNSFAASSGGTDSYAITISPVIATYTDGDVFVFEADVANTGAATLNVSAVGAKTIKKYGNIDLATGDIKAGSIVVVVYDADSDTLMMVSSISRPQVSQDGAEVYAADSVGTDSYAVTLTPAPSAYATGLVVRFKAGTANTGAASLNVNGLGAVTIKKFYNTDLETGDILQNQIVSVIHDGTNFQMLSALPRPIYKCLVTNRAGDTASGDQTIAHGLGRIPRRAKLTIRQANTGGGDAGAFCEGVYDGTTQVVVWMRFNAATAYQSDSESGKIAALHLYDGSNKQEATIAWDATNVTLTWTKTGAPDLTDMEMLLEVEG